MERRVAFELVIKTIIVGGQAVAYKCFDHGVVRRVASDRKVDPLGDAAVYPEYPSRLHISSRIHLLGAQQSATQELNHPIRVDPLPRNVEAEFRGQFLGHDLPCKLQTRRSGLVKSHDECGEFHFRRTMKSSYTCPGARLRLRIEGGMVMTT